MKRWLVTLCIVSLLLIVFFIGLGWWDRRPPSRAVASSRPVPSRTTAPVPSVGGDAPERLAPAYASVNCTAEVPGRLVAMMGPQIVSAEGSAPSLSLSPGEWWVQWQTDARTVDLGHVLVETGDVLRCVINDESGTVHGRVRTHSGRALSDASVNIRCGPSYRSDVTTDDHGNFSFDVPPLSMAGACRVVASIQTGALSRQSDEEEITAFDRDSSIEIELDDRPVAGLGIGLLPIATGVQVGEVFPKSPAARAGVHSGDLILAVNGTSVVGMSGPDFKRLATGEEGSSVELQILRGEERMTLRFRREKIEEPKDTGSLPTDAPPVEWEAPEHGGTP